MAPESDLTLANLDVHALGDSKVTASWIWEVFQPATGHTAKRQSKAVNNAQAADTLRKSIADFITMNVELISN